MKFVGYCKICSKYGHKAEICWNNPKKAKCTKGTGNEKGRKTGIAGKGGKGDGKKGGKPTVRDGGCFICGAQGHMARDSPRRVLAVTEDSKEKGDIDGHIGGLEEVQWMIGGIVGACDAENLGGKPRPLLVESGALRSVVGKAQFVGRSHDPDAKRPLYDVSGNKLPHYGP